MQAGRLDQTVTLRSATEANVDGELQQSWADAATVNAYVISQRGTEAFEAGRQNAREIIRLQLRYRSDVTDKWRVLWNGQEYDITAVDRSNRRKGELWLTAQASGVS